MFEAAELGRTVSKSEFREQAPQLRWELLQLQQRLRQAPFPVLVIFAGVDGAGKSEAVNLLNAWMDPRWIVTRSFAEPTEEERQRPEYWRYWRSLPRAGTLGLFLSTWYSAPLLERVYRKIGGADFEQRLQRILQFERLLANDGALILKFWMHLGKAAQKKRLKTLERSRLTRWRVTEQSWKHWRMYRKFVVAAEQAIRRTSTGQAPWHIVEGLDSNYRTLIVATRLRDAIRQRLDESSGKAGAAAAIPEEPNESGARPTRGARELLRRVARRRSILAQLDMKQSLAKKTFGVELETYQGRLNQLQRRAQQCGISTILVFEGWDAAGKGGAIRRLTAALDARSCQVLPIAAPSDEERAHHYLWRFWRHLSDAGRITIFDRSWYGRVLVERVEGLASPQQWLRAYNEINQFEEQLVEHGIVLVKYWMHITKEEQLRRFRLRKGSAYKRWKLTADDWRNRKKWAEYELAVNDMIERTSTRTAPWTLIEGNDKNFARIKVLRTACSRLQAGLKNR